MKNKKIVIAGAGIAGSFLALLLSKRGYNNITIIEKRIKKDVLDEASRRSYNITLYGYALNLLHDEGLWDKLKHEVIPLKGSVTHISGYQTPIVSLTDINTPYFAVSRTRLLDILLKEVLRKKISVKFGHSLTHVNKRTRMVTIDSNDGRSTTFPVSLLVGADGINSSVRSFLLKEKGAKFLRDDSNWVYRQIKMSQKTCKKIGLRHNFAYTWSSKNMVIASFPNKDKSINAMLITPMRKAVSVETVIKHFPMLLSAKEEIILSIKKSPVGSFATIHTSPWFYKDFMVVVGDAAHAFNPFFGQGVSAALGDCSTLAKHLETSKNPLPEYENQRKIQMDTLGELSKEGFERYRRYKKADPAVISDRVVSILHKFIPNFIHPPVFESIATDPSLSYNYLIRTSKQKEILKIFGLGLMVTLVGLGLEMKESLTHVVPRGFLRLQGKNGLIMS